MTAHDRYSTLRDRLTAQGVSQGSLDAFSHAVRVMEDEALARVIRASAGDASTGLGRDVSADHLHMVAAEIEAFRA